MIIERSVLGDIFDKESLKKIIVSTHEHIKSSGDVLLSQGDKIHGIYFVVRGSLIEKNGALADKDIPYIRWSRGDIAGLQYISETFKDQAVSSKILFMISRHLRQ